MNASILCVVLYSTYTNVQFTLNILKLFSFLYFYYIVFFICLLKWSMVIIMIFCVDAISRCGLSSV